MARVKGTCCSWVWFSSSLNEKGPHRLISLNTWSVDGTVWEGPGGMALLRWGASRGRLWGFKILFPFPVCLSFCLRLADKDVSSLLLPPSCLCSTVHGSTCMWHMYPGDNQQFSNGLEITPAVASEVTHLGGEPATATSLNRPNS